jgi:hypothetical protein
MCSNSLPAACASVSSQQRPWRLPEVRRPAKKQNVLVLDETVCPSCVGKNRCDEKYDEGAKEPKSQHHLYEIHTAPQSDLVSAILSAEDVIELARLRDYLGNFGASDEGCEGFGGMVAGGLGRGVWRL